jgi:hypothetical protein
MSDPSPRRRSSLTSRRNFSTLVLAVLFGALAFSGCSSLVQPEPSSVEGLTDSTLPSPSSDNQVPPGGFGPNGEVPLDGLTEEDMARFAEGLGITIEEFRFISGEGSVAIMDFLGANEGRDDFGAFRVSYENGARFQIRVTRPDSDLPAALAQALGREVDVFVGGRSGSQLMADMDEVASILAAATTSYLDISYGPDFESGVVIVRMDSTALPDLTFPNYVVVLRD